MNGNRVAYVNLWAALSVSSSAARAELAWADLNLETSLLTY